MTVVILVCHKIDKASPFHIELFCDSKISKNPRPYWEAYMRMAKEKVIPQIWLLNETNLRLKQSVKHKSLAFFKRLLCAGTQACPMLIAMTRPGWVCPIPLDVLFLYVSIPVKVKLGRKAYYFLSF